jgi:hydrogenase nickel incorporation protein HypA/HybF
MHELSLSSAIVDTALRHCDGRRVTQVDVRVGRLRQVVPESLAFYFEIVCRDTLCDGARLKLEQVEAILRCRACNAEWDPAPPPLATHEPWGDAGLPPVPAFRCPTCAGAESDVLSGDELEVESIEVADAESSQATGASTLHESG